ncbi:alpha-L-rhamnosidase [Parabacteroides sp. FAFU027]|uniref:alpha-L-rhamnosidase n=1 Tax=Parabacteroides sp. FAFU027 TaxID=2922715 RepID=UPI001FAFE192|nr:alpha-L-rhamnosidase [Parabacteroides sp. FAFU027]
MTKRIRIFISLLLLGSFVSFNLKASGLNIIKLCTEYTEKPLGIDVNHPRFSWQMTSDKSGCSQTAYRIIVVDEAKQKVWDSGKVSNSESLNIRYAGNTLKPGTHYSWKVMVWDQQQKMHIAESSFETGLMNPDPKLSAWDGAKWIGGNDEDMVLYSAYLPVFKINYSLQLDKTSGSTKAGLILGANDIRLMDKNKNLFKQENKQDSSYILVELDITPLQSNQPAKINIYRCGYTANDTRDVPFKTFPVPESLINAQNRYDKHTVYLSIVLGDTRIGIDGEGQENSVGGLNLNPFGAGGDHLAFPVIGQIGFQVPANQSAIFSNLQIRNHRAPSNLLYSAYSKPLKVEGDQSGKQVLFDPSKNSMPMLRSTFTTSLSPIAKARLYVTSRGIYEMYINGKRIGNDYFNPGSTQYNKTQLYQTYDVTQDLLSGKNAIGAILGEGWWSGGITYMGDYWNFFGDRQSLLAKLVITYADGKAEVITTQPSRWKYFNNGPVVYGSFFQGEVYDATKEALVKDWSKATYDDSAWKESVEVSLEGRINDDKASGNVPGVGDYSKMQLTGQIGKTVKPIKELTAISVDEIRPGVFIYDMGQNMAGVPHISLKNMAPGKKIFLRFAEVKYPDLPAYKENTGMIMLENIRAAMAQDIYISKGGDEIYSPRFTYHGYRYVEITGIEKSLPLNAVKGIVLSSIHELTSKYETSNPKVNKLWENITWSSFANFMSIPTDCPQRNERLGWSGDISVFSRTATYLASVPQFLRRHMRAMRDVQREDGRFPDVAPLGVGFGETMWGSAGITIPWECYQQYDDKDLLSEHYDAMKKYIDYLIRDIDPVTGVFKEKERNIWFSLSDWLSLEDSRNEKTLFWEAYFIYDLEIMSKVARILDKKEDAERFAKLCAERKAFFNKTYLDSVTGKTAFRGKVIDTQTSYVLPFAFNIFDEAHKELAKKNLATTITRTNRTDQNVECPPYSLMTGFIGTAWVNRALSDNGYSDLAYRLLQQTTYPSWIYPIEQGATTIWERLNSYTVTDGFGTNNSMNSFNHYSFGAVGDWMYSYSLGIARDENSPGFKHFILQPEPDPTGKMTFAKGYYESMYGRIESSWQKTATGCEYCFVVPANTTATLKLKASSLNGIRTKVKLLPSAIKDSKTGVGDGKYTFELQPGRYVIQVSGIK